jgi:hypothetical protein
LGRAVNSTTNRLNWSASCHAASSVKSLAIVLVA